MIELIVGEKGKGKTKTLTAKANNDVKTTGGSIIYLDSNNKLMFELSHNIRLINVEEYSIDSSDRFVGFINGILSQNNTLDKIFLDNFASIAYLDSNNATEAVINELTKLSDKFEVDFIIGITAKKEELPDSIKELITIEL